MELEGRFTSPENLAEVMSKLGTERSTGSLVLRCGTSIIDFDFYHGSICGSENPHRPRRLGQLLLNRNLIDRVALDEALAYQADFSRGTPIGRVLIHRDRLTLNDLRDTVRLQLEEEIADILSHGDGFYQFKPTQPTDDEAPLVELNPETIVRDVLNRREAWERIRTRIPNEQAVPSVLKLGGASDREALHLTRRDWDILSLVNGNFDVGCIASRSGLGRFETYMILDSFLSTGIIEFKPGREPAPDSITESKSEAPDAGVNVRQAGMSSTRWSGILSRLRDDNDRTEILDSARLNFDSPVAFLVEVSNEITRILMTDQDFIVDPSDERLAERYWRQVLMSHPRADLVSAHMNLLSSDSFDRYTRSLGVDGITKSIYLETIDALGRHLRTLYLLSAQRLGSKAARLLFANVMEEIKHRSTIANSDSFFFKEVAAKVLE